MTPLRLGSPITEIKGIGPAKAAVVKKLGITHIRDLLYSFPRRYEDFSHLTPIKDLTVGQQTAIRGRIQKVKSNWGWQGKRRLLRIYVDIADDTGTIHATWYNLRFLERQLAIGREVYIAGKVEPYTYAKSSHEFAMRSPSLEFGESTKEESRIHTAAITPVYSETKGVTSRFLRYHIKQLLPLVGALPEYIPLDIRKRHSLIGIVEALTVVHFPQSQAELAEAQRRLRFDELFFLQLAALSRRQQYEQHPARPIKISKQKLASTVAKLKFSLTNAQKTAIDEIREDVKKPHPMNRLLQGDVGSGKSAVAQIAAAATLAAGYKVIYLAPTEILARQQAQSFAAFLGEDNVSLLIGALQANDKMAIKQQLLATGSHCIIGTHALLQEDVRATDVALVVVDEQHRFGVSQRQTVRHLEENTVPHLLSMTATPIPRTLNLTVYGDLDVSTLDELPPGRKSVITSIVLSHERDEAIIHVLEELHTGRQGYVITPLVATSSRLEAKSAEKAFAEIKELFPGIAVGLLHGRMDSDQKESTMRNFAAGAIQLLISTAVVEVGVNVPNATIMIIEGAERFGLAQLHQFRGRIGRGEAQSYCYVFPTSDEDVATPRLQVLASTTDGFVIAEEDLKLRGPGEIYGVSQSGFGDLKVASLLDYPTIKAARGEAKKLLQEDPLLSAYPILQQKVAQKNLQTHFE